MQHTHQVEMMQRARLLCIVIAASILGCGANPAPNSPVPMVVGGQTRAASPAPTRRPTRSNSANPAQDVGTRIAIAAESHVGVTKIYDAQYIRLDYPNGDVPREPGACTDVIVCAFRAVGVDLQVRVHEDMQKNFGVYPRDWGLKAPDANIDHRRLQNLTKYFDRMRKQVNRNTDDNFKPGDVVAWKLGSWMQHINSVGIDTVPGSNRHSLIHNIGGGTKQEDVLHYFTIIAHQR